MDKSSFLKLLHKYLRGDATNEECQFLYNYYNLFESEPDITALLNDGQEADLKNSMKRTIWQSINDDDSQQNKQVQPLRRRLITWVSAAALILMIFTAGIVVFVKKSPNVKLAISHSGQQKEHRLIRLPDGSTVIVSAGSKLNYPSSFDGLAKRHVYLEGQAYFDIKHNPSKPFIVHTGKLETTVLGTAFNVKAWPAEAVIIVTVSRGKVKVVENNKILGIITPDQQITYNKKDDNIIQKTVDSDSYLAWKEQDLLFDNVTVAEAAELLEERFKVSILCRNELIKSKRFTTTFLKNESLEQVLKSICEFNEAVYTYDKEKATVIINSKSSIKLTNITN